MPVTHYNSIFDIKFTLLIVITICIQSVTGQIVSTNIDSTKLPKEAKYLGHIKNSVTYLDGLGTNYVLAAETGEYNSKTADDDDLKNAALYVYHYIGKSNSLKLLWRIYDFNKECEFDIDVRFIDNTFKVTDLDKNGIAEVWVMFENVCTSDVSPAPTKIIMYEGEKKYALRGQSKVRISEKDFLGGQYTLDDNLKNGNRLFKQYAIDLWEEHKLKKW